MNAHYNSTGCGKAVDFFTVLPSEWRQFRRTPTLDSGMLLATIDIGSLDSVAIFFG
jgi:hypothetical protein